MTYEVECTNPNCGNLSRSFTNNPRPCVKCLSDTKGPNLLKALKIHEEQIRGS